MNDIGIIERPATFTVRPLTEPELRLVAGGVLIGLLLPAVQKVSCSNNLKQIGLALHG